eukprot:scaffold634_cov97-Cylindrotheca_fusiformis.AAC.4
MTLDVRSGLVSLHTLRQGVTFFCSYRSTIGYRSQRRIPLNALAPRRAGSDVRTGKVYACWYIESKKSNTSTSYLDGNNNKCQRERLPTACLYTSCTRRVSYYS